jgi:hypothetical protein
MLDLPNRVEHGVVASFLAWFYAAFLDFRELGSEWPQPRQKFFGGHIGK